MKACRVLAIRVAERERSPRSVIPAALRGTKESWQTPGMARPSVPIVEDADRTKLPRRQPIPLENEEDGARHLYVRWLL